MKTIINKILIDIIWRFLFKQISKIQFTNILNNLTAYARTLSFIELIRFIKLMLLDRFPANETLIQVFKPF